MMFPFRVGDLFRLHPLIFQGWYDIYIYVYFLYDPSALDGLKARQDLVGNFKRTLRVNGQLFKLDLKKEKTT